MTKWFKKWLWPTVRVSLPIVIVTGGIVFVIFATIHKLIDVDSARYLLSAIVQALSALLAIIFAGVAILWGHETDAIKRLEILKPEYDKIFGKQPVRSIYYTLVESIRKMLVSLFTDDNKRKDVEKLAHAIKEPPLLTLNRISAWKYSLKAKLKKILNDDGKIVQKRYPEGWRWIDIKSMSTYQKLLGKVEDYFKLIRRIDRYTLKFQSFANKEKGTGKTLSGHFRSVRRKLARDGVDHLLKVLDRGRDARGSLFLTLILLYSITIAGGMIVLSMLKESICAVQVCWLVAGPLLFAIGAVALTFYYLARIVSGEKDA